MAGEHNQVNGADRGWVQRAVEALALALGYFILCRLAQVPAVAPWNASPFWPASGVGLAALVLGSQRLWPGIWLGSFAFHALSLVQGQRAIVPTDLALAAIIGCGDAAQALAGCWLIRLFLRKDEELGQRRSLLRALLLGGPAACLVSPIVSVVAIAAFRSPPAADLVWTGWVWWFGHTAGVLVVLPLAVAFGREMPRAGLAKAVGLGSLVVTVALWQSAEAVQSRHLSQKFSNEARDYVEFIRGDVNHSMDVLRALGLFYAGSNPMDRSEFTIFAQPLLEWNGALQALVWAPRVPRTERLAFEAAARTQGYEGFTVMDLAPDGRLVPAADRRDYFPAYYIEPMPAQESALGFDPGSDPERRAAMVRARDSGFLAATSHVTLAVSGQRGLLLFVPVYKGGQVPASIEGRRKLLRGYMVGVCIVANMVDNALEAVRPKGIDVSLFDESVGTQLQHLYSRSEGRAPATSRIGAPWAPLRGAEGLDHTATLDFGGRRLRVVCTPTEAYLAANRSWGPLGLLAFGLLLTAVLTRHLRIVAERSAAVEAANAGLRQEVERRQDTERRLRDLYNNMPDMYASVAADTAQVLDCNRTLLHVLGYHREELIGRPMFDLYDPQSVPAAREAMEQFQATGQVRNADLIFRRKDGTPLDVVMNMTAVRDADGRIVRSRSIWRDITELKLARTELEFQHAQLTEVFALQTADLRRANIELEHSNRRLTELYETAHRFVDNVSHEFRTPLTVIKGFTDVLLRGLGGPLSPVQREWMCLISDRTRDLSQMVDDLLDTSRLRSGLLRVDRRTVAVKEILDRVWPVLRAKAEANGVILDRHVPGDLPTVYADAEKAGRVVINLVVNAVKFSREGSVVVVWADRGPDRTVEIGITDSGPGIDPEHLEAIFQRFMQAGDPHRSSTKGFGLGLNIAKELTALNLGRMGVVSKMGRGSTFFFTVPCGEPQAILEHYLQRLVDLNPPGRELVLIEATGDSLHGREEELCGMIASHGQPMDLLLPGRCGDSSALLLRVGDDGWATAEELTRTWAKLSDVSRQSHALPPVTFLAIKTLPRPVDKRARGETIEQILGVLEDAQARDSCRR